MILTASTNAKGALTITLPMDAFESTDLFSDTEYCNENSDIKVEFLPLPSMTTT